ncbi:MAG: Piwi domain-containing protein [Bacteroidales bacterium]|jgi:hypothetical protein|nr:Piwi domain-containing protein [Bacteroidales bacterium]
MTTNQETTDFHLNLMPFRFAADEIKVGFSTAPSALRQGVSLKSCPKDIQRFYPDLDENAPIYLYFDPPKNFTGQLWLVSLGAHRKIARCYAYFLLYRYFTQEEAYLQSNFVSDLIIWVYDTSLPSNIARFNRIQLKVKYYEEDKQASLGLSFLGKSYILKDSLETLDHTQPGATKHLKKVIYNKQILHHRHLPDEAHAKRDIQYPILSRDLMRALHIHIPPTRNIHKHQVQWEMAQRFFKDSLADRPETGLIFEKGWSELRRLFQLQGTTKALLFGQDRVHTDIYRGLKNYGSYKPLKVKQLVCFFIYTAEEELAKEKLRASLLATNADSGLGVYMKLAVHHEKGLDICLKKGDNMGDQLAEQLSHKSLDSSLAYMAIYVSPFDKYTGAEAQRKVYYQIKEQLLKRGIASQAFVGAKATNPQTKFQFWVPNIAMAAIAKLGGIPWVLSKTHQSSLVVGFGMYKLPQYDLKFEASSFVFADDGHFKGFDYYPASESTAIAAKLEEALNQYLLKHGKPKRLVMHYYKTLSNKQFMPVKKMLDAYDPGLAFYVVRVNQGRTDDFFVKAVHDAYGLPADGSVFRLSGQDYLLYVNGYTGEGKPKSQPMPVRCYLQANKAALLHDEQTVKALLQQVYDFTRLYWRSVRQPSVPVTIDYPRMLVSQTAWFKDSALPGGLEERPWFL